MPAVMSDTRGAAALAACACTSDSATSSMRRGANSLFPRCIAVTSVTVVHVDAASFAAMAARATPHLSCSQSAQPSLTSLRTSFGPFPDAC